MSKYTNKEVNKKGEAGTAESILQRGELGNQPASQSLHTHAVTQRCWKHRVS